MAVEVSIVVGKEAVGLVSTVVLGSESPVDVREYGFVLVVLCSKDSASFF